MTDQLSLFGDLLSPEVDRILREFAVPVKSDGVETLKTEIMCYLDRIVQAQRENEFLNEPLARRIGEIGVLLLDSYHSYTKEQQSFITGAVRYFLLAKDKDNDLHSPLGFDDDAEVMKFVLKSIGRENLMIDIEGDY